MDAKLFRRLKPYSFYGVDHLRQIRQDPVRLEKFCLRQIALVWKWKQKQAWKNKKGQLTKQFQDNRQLYQAFDTQTAVMKIDQSTQTCIGDSSTAQGCIDKIHIQDQTELAFFRTTKEICLGKLENRLIKSENSDHFIDRNETTQDFIRNSVLLLPNSNITVLEVEMDNDFSGIRGCDLDLVQHETCNTKIEKSNRRNKHISCTNQGFFQCEVCRLKFNTPILLADHKSNVNHNLTIVVDKCTLCDKLINTVGNLVEHECKARKIEKPFKCDLCSVGFYRKYKLEKHKTSHFDHRPYQCELCGKHFKMLEYLKKHSLLHLTKENAEKSDHICEVCGQQFLRRSDLTMHQRKLKHIAGLLQCDECDKLFSCISSVYRHKKETHLNAKPHICELCGHEFTRKQTLMDHKLTHSGQLKPYSCDECGMTYTQKTNLVIHKRKHSGVKPFKCDRCPKSFAWSRSLDIHKRTHLPAKPYACNVCDKTFREEKNLASHGRLHTGVKPFKCLFCGEQFRYHSQLKRHKTRHVDAQT